MLISYWSRLIVYQLLFILDSSFLIKVERQPYLIRLDASCLIMVRCNLDKEWCVKHEQELINYQPWSSMISTLIYWPPQPCSSMISSSLFKYESCLSCTLLVWDMSENGEAIRRFFGRAQNKWRNHSLIKSDILGYLPNFNDINVGGPTTQWRLTTLQSSSDCNKKCVCVVKRWT